METFSFVFIFLVAILGYVQGLSIIYIVIRDLYHDDIVY